MIHYKLRTLLILLAVLPPLLWIGWTKFAAWKADQERLKAVRQWRFLLSVPPQPLPAKIGIPQPGPEPPPPPDDGLSVPMPVRVPEKEGICG